jgi:uncharacterized protein (DUF736 family)
MTHIGNFKRTKSGYAGRIHTLTLDAELVLNPADHSDAENAPDYRIHRENAGGWRGLETRQRESGRLCFPAA